MIRALRLPFAVTLCLVFLDQALKIWIKSNLSLGESIEITSWFQLHFTENPGMAFGMEWGGIPGKYMLSSFRVVAIIGIVLYMLRLAKAGAGNFVLIAFSIVLAGAFGNVIDSLLYGLIFDKGLVYSEGYKQWVMYSGVANWSSNGYAPILLGNVVDMLYFPIWKGVLPSWVPIWGNDYFIFFRPIFNIADSCVTIGVILLYWSSRKTEKWGTI
ncbi:MAG: Lipoprotein signal peptidase [Owenweeksia sp. TMED14]|nr:MAG: Lipoprotein signal peptidase [Owenweeksia sp. TMED14]